MAPDRLSDLPEGILIYILRRMEIQDAVRTSVLSKQWNETRLWTQLPSLRLNADSFDSLESFQYFLFGLVTHYDASKLYSLRYACNDFDVDNNLLETIIDYAASNNVEHLWINCTEVPYFQLPHRLQACRFLAGLTLERLSFEFPVPFFSASLTSLCLDRACIDNDIVLVCKNLEKFLMMECSISVMSKIVIDAPKLVMLDIQYERLDDSPKEMLVLICSPKLESLALHFKCESYLNVSVDRCPNLKSATIDFYDTLEDTADENTEDILERRKYATNLVNLLKVVSESKSLTLSSGVIQLLSAITEQVKNVPSPFHNLNYLEVYKKYGQQYIIIPPEVETFLVEGSPNASELLKGLQSLKETPK